MQKLAFFFVFIFAGFVNAADYNFNGSVDAVTTRVDGSTVSGVVTYQIFGGNPGGALIQIVDTDLLVFSGTVTVTGNAAEFYAVACEDGECGLPSSSVLVQCNRAAMSTTNLTINLECK